MADEHHVLGLGMEPINARKAFAKLERRDRDGIAGRITEGPELETPTQHRIGLDGVYRVPPHSRFRDEPVNENNRNSLGIVRLPHGQTGGAIVAIDPHRFYQPKEERVRIIGERRGEISGQRTGRARDPNGFAQGSDRGARGPPHGPLSS